MVNLCWVTKFLVSNSKLDAYLKNKSYSNDTHEHVVFGNSSEDIHLIRLSGIKLIKDLHVE